MKCLRLNYSIGIQLEDDEGEKLNVWIFVKNGVLNVWIFVKNGDLNVWIFEKMALQGIVDNEKTFRLLGEKWSGFRLND